METYTFILEFLGGTYISQVESNNHIQALKKWATELDIKPIFGLGIKNKELLIKSLDEDWHKPVLLNGLINVWHFHANLKGGSAFLNYVKTNLE